VLYVYWYGNRYKPFNIICREEEPTEVVIIVLGSRLN
jgi:hypothetical protein